MPWGQLGGPAPLCQGRPSLGGGLHLLTHSLSTGRFSFRELGEVTGQPRSSTHTSRKGKFMLGLQPLPGLPDLSCLRGSAGLMCGPGFRPKAGEPAPAGFPHAGRPGQRPLPRGLSSGTLCTPLVLPRGPQAGAAARGAPQSGHTPCAPPPLPLPQARRVLLSPLWGRSFRTDHSRVKLSQSEPPRG